MKRIKIREYKNCINIEIGSKVKPAFRAAAFLAAVSWGVLFIYVKSGAFLLPWALIQSGLVYLLLWLFLQKTTIAVFPEYVLVARNYFFMDITGRFFQRDSISGLKKDGNAITFKYLGRSETLVKGLSREEAAYVMKFMVFSLNSPEFDRGKPDKV